jgi:hypothetical protein
MTLRARWTINRERRHDVTDDDLQIMTDLRDELDQFAEMVKQGRA